MIDSEGLLRCKGRYDNVDLAESVKYPKVLPKGEYYTKLIINDYHSRLIHLAGIPNTCAHMERILDLTW